LPGFAFARWSGRLLTNDPKYKKADGGVLIPPRNFELDVFVDV